MICPICFEEGIRVVTPCYYQNKVVEACYKCMTERGLKGAQAERFGEYPKVHIPAMRDGTKSFADKLERYNKEDGK